MLPSPKDKTKTWFISSVVWPVVLLFPTLRYTLKGVIVISVLEHLSKKVLDFVVLLCLSYEEKNDLLKAFVTNIVVDVLLLEICSSNKLLFNLLWGKINNT